MGMVQNGFCLYFVALYTKTEEITIFKQSSHDSQKHLIGEGFELQKKRKVAAFILNWAL